MEAKNCRQLLDSLSDYVDGSLGDELCAEIDRHMENCVDCQIVVDSLRKTIYLYRQTAPRAVVPSDVKKRLYHRLDLDEFLERDHPWNSQ